MTAGDGGKGRGWWLGRCVCRSSQVGTGGEGCCSSLLSICLSGRTSELAVPCASTRQVDAEEAGKGQGAPQQATSVHKGWSWGYFAPVSLKAPPLEEEPPLDSVAFRKQQSGSSK